MISTDFSRGASPGMGSLATYVRSHGLLRRRYLYYWLLLTILLAALGSTAVTFVAVGDTWWQMVIAPASALILVHFAFLVHDSSHFQIFRSARANEYFSIIMASLVIGASYSWWQAKHTRHHKNPNHITLDPDVSLPVVPAKLTSGFLRRLPVVRTVAARQGLLLFPLMFLEGLSLYFESWKYLLAQRKVRYRYLQLGLMTLHAVAVALLLLFTLSWGVAAAVWGVHIGLFGFYLGMVFALNHKGMPLIADNGKSDFLLRQVLVSRNIISSRFLAAAMGGLNNQIEHHLFPTAPRPVLFELARIVKAYCNEHGVPYTETTLTESYRRVYRYVNKVGIGRSDDYVCPLGEYRTSQNISTCLPPWGTARDQTRQ